MDGAAVARDINTRILELTERFAYLAADTEWDFRCECGCLAVVPLTRSAYLAGGAWLSGHRPAAAPDARVA